jgi:hypothetical protein
VFVGLPIVAGGNAVRFVPAAATLLVACPVLVAFASRRRSWATAPLVVGLVTVELLGSAAYAQAYEGGTIFTGLESGAHPILVPQVLRFPELDEDAYLRVTPIVRYLRRHPGRYATWAPPEAYFEKGYLGLRSPLDWPALAPSRGTLFGVPDALGYNPVQLPRYWRYVRATNELSVFYNAAVLNEPSPEDVRLLGLRYLVVPSGLTPPVPGRIVEEADRYSLWQLDDAEPLATTAGAAMPLAADVRQALRYVTTPGFDPAEVTIVERPVPVTAIADVRAVDGSIRRSSPTELRVRLEPAAAGVLTIRVAFDPGWRAVADGRPAATMPVDGFLEGVVLPAETHEVVLTYHDDAVITGLAIGAVVWPALLVAPLVPFVFERRRKGR